MPHNGFRGTVGVKLSHRRAFLCITNIFVVPSHSVQPTLKTLAWRSMHPKVCFGGKLIPRGQNCPWGLSLPFYAPRTFNMGLIGQLFYSLRQLSESCTVNRKYLYKKRKWGQSVPPTKRSRDNGVILAWGKFPIGMHCRHSDSITVERLTLIRLNRTTFLFVEIAQRKLHREQEISI